MRKNIWNIKNLDFRVLKVMKKIEALSFSLNVPVYFTGGIVRDGILKNKNLDIDIFIEYFNISFIKNLEYELNTIFKIYPEFQNASCSLSSGISLDISVIRKEDYLFSGALPVVSLGNFSDNIYRRDFSINSIVVYRGKIIDICNGLRDLKNRELRILYPNSFSNDPTRILRGIKFAIRYNLFFEKKTYTHLLEGFHNNYLLSLTHSRFMRELLDIFSENKIIDFFKNSKYDEIRYLFLGDFNWNIIIEFLIFYKKNIKIFRSEGEKFNNNPFFYIMDILNIYPHSQNKSSKSIHEQFFHELVIGGVSNSFSSFLEANHDNRLTPQEIYIQYKVFSKKEILLLLFHFRKNKKISHEINSFFYLKNTSKLVSGNDLINNGLKPGKNFKTILENCFLLQLNNPNISKNEILNEVLEDFF